MSSNPEVDAVVIGAGFAGILATHSLVQNGFTVRTFEAGASVGGTWYWNRYPGARCDVESLEYQYRFTPELGNEWTWTERYATQPEILAYAEWVTDRLDVRRHMKFNEPITQAVFDEDNHLWVIETEKGTRVTARHLVAGSGSISATQLPDYPGVDEYAGEVYHTGRWPAEGVDFTGKKVAVIGVGSSGVQVIPELAKQAEELVVFQRTPAYTVPARNRPLYADEIASARRLYPQIMEEVNASYSGNQMHVPSVTIKDLPPETVTPFLERSWKLGGNHFVTTFPDMNTDLESNTVVADFVRQKLRDIVEDPETARKLTPTTYPIGAKRIITDTDYWATFNQPHVKLVHLPEEPIEGFTTHGIQTSEQSFEFDAIVCATGYDNMTGALTRINLQGRNGVTMRETWADGVHTYLGLMVHGFPNLYLITGPQSPSVVVNMFAAIEQHVEWIVRTVTTLREQGQTLIEPTVESEEWWAEQVETAFGYSLYPYADSWYRGANVPGKKIQPLMFVGGLNLYRDLCDDVAQDNYRGFTLAVSG